MLVIDVDYEMLVVDVVGVGVKLIVRCVVDRVMVVCCWCFTGVEDV